MRRAIGLLLHARLLLHLVLICFLVRFQDLLHANRTVETRLLSCSWAYDVYSIVYWGSIREGAEVKERETSNASRKQRKWHTNEW